MTKGLLSAILIATMLPAGAAISVDLPSTRAPFVYYTPPPPLWTGFYAGLNLGGGWNSNSNNSWAPYTDVGVPGSLLIYPGSTNSGNASGVVGGGQIGYNYQIVSSFLIGVEADIQGTSMNSGGNNAWTPYLSPLGTGNLLTPLAPNSAGVDVPWFGTVRGRVGYLIKPTILVYGTAGFAYGGVSGNVTGYSNTQPGWTAGGGVEWMLMPQLSAKIEYLYIDLENNGTTGPAGYSWSAISHPQVNVVRAGVNYHFHWGTSGSAVAPLVAKY